MVAAHLPLTRQTRVCPARRYAAGPGFAAQHDGIRDGLACWLREIVDATARGHGIDPDTAVRQQLLRSVPAASR